MHSSENMCNLAPEKTNTMDTKTIIKIICVVLTAIATALAAAFGLTSCTASRVVSTQSSYFTRGDTTTTIVTKTTETYTANKNRQSL